MTTSYITVDGAGAKPDKNTILKDPDAVLDYPFDWTAWLGTTETIVAATGTADGVTQDGITIDVAGKIVVPILSGGTAGETATYTMHIVTSDDREEDRTIRLKIAER